MTNKVTKKSFLSIFNFYPEIKLVYFFGSRAENHHGPLSDYDFAIFLDAKDKKKMFKIKLELLDKITRALKTDEVDIVILNMLDAPEMKYNIITDGKLIFKKEPFKILTEPSTYATSSSKSHSYPKVSLVVSLRCSLMASSISGSPWDSYWFSQSISNTTVASVFTFNI